LGRDDLSEHNLLLLDGNSLINRAFYGLFGRHNLTAPDGTPTGALFAFFNMYLKLIDDVKPTHVVAAFDRKEPTFRHKIYDDYKGTRKPMPDELAVQIPLLKELLHDFGVSCLEIAGFEADDLIGTLAVIGARQMPVTIVSGDKDSFQLAAEQIVILQPVTRSGRTETENYDPQAIKARYGVSPRQFIDVKALMGDPSDNIPGVRGIGEKTAIELVSQYGSLEKIYESLDQIRPAVAKKLESDREMAFLSRELSAICLSVPMADDLDGYRLSEMNHDLLTEKLTKLGFKTLLSRLNLVSAAKPLSDRQAEVSAATADELAADLQGRQSPVALFMTPDHPLCWIDRTDRVCWLPAAERNQAWSILVKSRQLFFVYDYKTWLRDSGLKGSLQQTHDVLVAAYLLSQLDGKPDLDRLYQRVTGEQLPSSARSAPYQGDRLPRQQSLLDMPVAGGHVAPVAGTDPGDNASPDAVDAVYVRALAAIGQRQRQDLEERKLLFIADEVEFPLETILASMEKRGFALDRMVLDTLSRQMAERLDVLQQDIYRLCGKSFNLNSPKQLSEVLFDDLGLKTGKKRAGGTWSTDADELERLSGDHPVISLIVDHRQTAKLKATFVEGLIKMIDPRDGRVHTTFNQTLTATGRLSSSEPNLQNIPIRTAEGRQIRHAFIAGPGQVLIDADYSQIELRLLAHLSGDPAMIEAFVNREDIHTDTACRIFGLSADQISSDMRSIAKTMNFSIVYGISDFGLARDLGVTVRQAHKWIAEYEARYPHVRQYLDSLVAGASANGYVETMFGRRRYLAELKSPNRNIRQFGERAAMNTPIQGTAADLIKIAMVRVDRALKEAGLKAQLILQVHDELIVEAPEHEADQAAELLQQAMEGAMALSVPLVAEVCRGHSWAACKNQDDFIPPDLTAED
jgi:DNA polymerase-1